MKWQARMFSRGRLTVPHDLLRRMRARSGDSLEFDVKKGGAYARVRLVRAKSSRKRKPF
jgi:bifunctional DNA-binding transcriptional regulator/antitoxin component of YhaV-PrlF toxin-antitoxin module